MNLYRPLTLTILLAIFVSTSCSKEAVRPSSSAGALTANSAFNNLPARPFERHHFNSRGFHFLNEFIRPDVRSRLDEEPAGDTDGSYDPGALETGTSQEEPQPESGGGDQSGEPETAATSDDDSDTTASRSDTPRFSWAKKSFGDAVRSDPTASGVIVLYADENYYDIGSLMSFVEEGRSRIAKASDIGGDRIQVVYGGYRGVPQLEMWIVPEGSMPEFRPDERSKQGGTEN